MSENENDNWTKRNGVSLLSIVLTILTIAYFGIIKGEADSNTIKVHSDTIVEMKAEIKALKVEKVDKETMTLIQLSLTEIKIDIRDIRLAQKYQKIE